jgi:MscS family membrane protein
MTKGLFWRPTSPTGMVTPARSASEGARNVLPRWRFGLVSLIVFLWFLLPGMGARSQEKPDAKYRSPRATIRTLFSTITLSHTNPQLIAEAAACLDLEPQPAGHHNLSGLRATQLDAILRAHDLDTERIPEQVDGDTYELPDDHGSHIRLKRMPDGRWLFDRETVAQIPKLFEEAQKHLQEKNREAANLNVSPDYASPRATFRTLINGYRRLNYERVLGCMDLGDIPAVAREVVGKQLAHKFKQIILKHRVPILQDIPDSNFSDPYIYLSLPEGVIEVVRLASGERKGEWVFSRETIRSLDRLYVIHEDQPYLPEVLALGATHPAPILFIEPELWLRSQLPGWLRTSIVSIPQFTLEVYELLGYVIVPVLAFGLHRFVTWLLTMLLHKVLVRRGWELPRETLVKRLRPIGRFLGVVFLRWGLIMLEPDRVLLVPMLVVLTPAVWFLGMWAIFRVIDLISDLIEVHLLAQKRRAEITQMLWPVSSLALKIGLFVATMFHLMSLFSWDVTAVVTGLGIGGLAFALGAQDSLKNLFGSFTLIADRPFVVGESVKIGNHEVGVIEVVGLRSTRIRTADDTLLIVPNSSLTTADITNYGRRRYRRYRTTIGLAYSNGPEQLIAFRDGIKELIRKHGSTRKDHFEVAINDLGASSIDVLVNVYFEVADRQQEVPARDTLILDILRLAEELHVELAYPTQTIHLVSPADGTERVAPFEEHSAQPLHPGERIP